MARRAATTCELVRDGPERRRRHDRRALADALDDLSRPQRAATSSMADERVRLALAHAIDTRGAAWRLRRASTSRPAGGGAIPPVMPGHGDECRLRPTTPSARGRCSRRPAIPDGDGPARAARRPRARGRPTAALAEQLAAVGMRHALRDARQVLGRLARDARVVLGLARRLPRPGRLLPRPARAATAVLPRRGDGRGAGDGARLARPRRAAAPVPRVRAHLDRPARGVVPLSYARQLVLRRPNVHGLRLNPMGAFHLEQVVVDAPEEHSA